MGLDYHFYFQVRTAHGWIVPADFTNQLGYGAGLGYFTWFNNKGVAAQLFWGKRAFFPMRSDPPPDLEPTVLYQYLSTGSLSSEAWDEAFQGWLPFEDLMPDYWDETHLFVSKKVYAPRALLFGDGAQPFPYQDLLAAGVSPQDVEKLEATAYFGNIVSEPIDHLYGKGRYDLESRLITDPVHLVEVSWKVTLSRFIGKERHEAFRNLRRFGRDEDIRILCLLR